MYNKTKSKSDIYVSIHQFLFERLLFEFYANVLAERRYL